MFFIYEFDSRKTLNNFGFANLNYLSHLKRNIILQFIPIIFYPTIIDFRLRLFLATNIAHD
jgi:hypothetical protein